MAEQTKPQRTPGMVEAPEWNEGMPRHCGGIGIRFTDGAESIAHVYYHPDHENAEDELARRFVLAWNSHDRLVDALKKLSAERHYHVGPGRECARCGHDLVSNVHFREGESEKDDRETARALIAEIEAGKVARTWTGRAVLRPTCQASRGGKRMTAELQTQCSWCRRFKLREGAWWSKRNPRPHLDITHGMCPTCHAKMSEEIGPVRIDLWDEAKRIVRAQHMSFAADPQAPKREAREGVG